MEIKSKMITSVKIKKEHQELFKAINKPEPSEADKKLLQEHFTENPHLWRQIADLSGRVEDSVIEKFSDSHLVRESYRLKLTAMRDSLGWNDSTEIEKILIEQVCLNWLRHNFLESVHFEKTHVSHSIETGLYWDKILTGAQKRYLRACESLAKVRKLLAEAELKEQQARNKRSKSTVIASKLLKDLTE
jgi:hypothetical protein